jgi:AcrR family transcriptional regulator
MSPLTGKPVASAERAGASDAPVRRTQRDRSSQAEKALMDAATRLFAERGVDQTSLADVGQAAGYSRGLVNHHFGTKAALVERLARRTQTDFVADLYDVHGDGIDLVLALVDNYLSAVEQRGEAARAFFVMWGAATPAEAALRPVFAEDDAEFRAGVEALLRIGTRDKTVDATVDPVLGAVALVGMLRGVAAQHLIDPEAFTIAAAAEACADFVRRSFAAPKPAKSARR